MEANLISRTRLWNHPNPVNTSTTIHFNLTQTGPVELGIYNLSGRQVHLLYYGEKVAGGYTVDWSPANLPAGTYYCRLKSREKMVTIKILIVE